MFGLKLSHHNIKYQISEVIFTECKDKNSVPSQPVFPRKEMHTDVSMFCLSSFTNPTWETLMVVDMDSQLSGFS